MKRNSRRLTFFLCLAGIAGLICACRTKTEEDLVRDFVNRIAHQVEKKDVQGLLRSLSEDYKDFEGRTKETTEAMVKDYFARYKGIVVHVLSTRVDRIEAPRAIIQTEAAISSGAAEVFRKLVRASLDNYRFNFQLIKTGESWQIQYAEWKYINLDELFPESLTILRKIFKDF